MSRNARRRNVVRQAGRIGLLLIASLAAPATAAGVPLQAAARGAADSSDTSQDKKPPVQQAPSGQRSPYTPDSQAVRGRITGQVTDTAGRPVAGAMARVGDRTATTDAGGSFSIDVDSAIVVLDVRAIGFQPYLQPQQLPVNRANRPIGTINVAITLRPSAAQLEEVVVQAKHTFQPDVEEWAAFLAVLLGLELGLRMSRRNRRWPPVPGAAAGYLFGRVYDAVYAGGLSLTVISGYVVHAAMLGAIAAAVLTIVPRIHGTASRIAAGAGAGVIAGLAVQIATTLAMLPVGPPGRPPVPLGPLNGLVDPAWIARAAWYSAISGAMFAAWVVLPPFGKPAARLQQAAAKTEADAT